MTRQIPPSRAASLAAEPPARAACFGPVAHNAWTRHEGRVSLVRTPLAPRPLLIAAEPDAVEIDIARSALVVVDMQNDFCHPQGWFGQKGIDVAPMREPITTIARLLPVWRAAGGRVVWLNWGVRADRLNLPPTVLFKGKREADAVGYAEASPEDRGPSVVPGHWGAQVIDELVVAEGDATVYKHRLTGFCDNELDSLLRQVGASTLLWAGVNTDRCVFSSLQDAGFLGYDNLLLTDACGTPSPEYVSRAIHFLVQQLHGFNVKAAAVMAAIGSLAGATAPTASGHAAQATTEHNP